MIISKNLILDYFKCVCFYCSFAFSCNTCSIDPFNFVHHDHNSEIYSWIKSGGNCNVVNKEGTSLLIHSVKLRNIRLVKFLLKQKCIDVNFKDNNKKTALDYAIDFEKIDDDSPMFLQHLRYDMCTTLVAKEARVTTVELDTKLRVFLLKGKPKYDKTLLGFCVDNSSNFVSCAAAYKMTPFLGPFLGVATNFIGSFFVYSIDRISQYRRFKKYHRSFLLAEF